MGFRRLLARIFCCAPEFEEFSPDWMEPIPVMRSVRHVDVDGVRTVPYENAKTDNPLPTINQYCIYWPWCVQSPENTVKNVFTAQEYLDTIAGFNPFLEDAPLKKKGRSRPRLPALF
jgi:hypothetical protein